MNASNRNERNGPPLSVTIVTTGNSLPVAGSTGTPGSWGGRTSLHSRPRPARRRRRRRTGSRSGTRGTGAHTWTSSPGTRPAARCRRWWSRTRRSRAARPGSVRSGGSRTPPCGVRLACGVPLVMRGQDQTLVPPQPQDRRLGHHVPVVADHRPDLAVLEDRFPAIRGKGWGGAQQ